MDVRNLFVRMEERAMTMLWSSYAFGRQSTELLEPVGMLLLQSRSFLQEDRKFLWTMC